MKAQRVLVVALAAVLATHASAWAQETGASAARDRALKSDLAWSIVESLTTEVGARPAGSPAMTRAKDWALAKLTALGFQNVRAEPFEAEAWTRGVERAEVTAPFLQPLQVLGLGRSVSTPPGGVEGEVAIFGSLDELIAQPPGSLKGKIVLINQPMARTMDGSGYGAISRNRTRGAAEASRRGASAFLVRSLSTGDSRSPHTGAMRQAEDAPAIPAAALSTADAELLQRMATRGGPVRVRLRLEARTTPRAPAWNVVAELPGRERPEEVVLVGGHLDSWDPGQGALDDGAGVAIAIAAARIAAEQPQGLKRTVRVVLWGAEEMDDSGDAYAAAHRDELSRLVVVGESDSGDGPVWQARVPRGGLAHPAMRDFVAALAPLKVVVSPEPATRGGADVEPLVEAGAPVVALTADTSRYFDVHHSADDMLDKVDRARLAQSVAVWSAFLYAVADSDVDFRALAPK
jgi:Zn-dependent M28 family amino/carboxypeptidase